MERIAFSGMALILTFMHSGIDPGHAARKALPALRVDRTGARVTRLEGSAEVMQQGKREWRLLKRHDVLRAGDEVLTGLRSRLELERSDQSHVRFADRTRFRILQLAYAEETLHRGAKVHVALGRSWVNLSKRAEGPKSDFDLSCENAVAGVRGTIYRMNVNEDQSALVRVYEGEVFVKGGGERTTQDQKPIAIPHKVAGPKKVAGPRKVSMEEWAIIRSMQQIATRSDGSADVPREFTEAEDRDPWVDWNQERDRAAKK